MFDYSKLTPKDPRDCAECGESFKPIRDEETLCLEHQYYADHPERAPRYWTWTRRGNQHWAVTARWPRLEELPAAGAQVTVHRRDGSISLETISDEADHRYDPSGDYIVTCDVERRTTSRR